MVSEFVQHHKSEIKELFGTHEYISSHKDVLSKNQILHSEISPEELKKISLLTTPNQVLAIVKSISQKLDTTLLNSSTSLFLDDIRETGYLLAKLHRIIQSKNAAS